MVTDASVSVALAGDTMLGRVVGERLDRDHALPLLADDVADIARQASLFVLNLECCISDRGRRARAPGKRFFFRAPPVAAERLAGMGVDCVTLANNHALDFGPLALLDTLEHLRGAGITFVGAGPDVDAARRPITVDAGGLHVRLVSVSDHPASSAAGSDRAGIAFADLAVEDVPAWLRKASTPGPDADIVIVSPHWGPNMTPQPVPHVRRAAAELEAAGATLVAGHSAHVPQGVHGRVLFDLGDFIDDYAVHPVLHNDLSLLWLVTLGAAGPRRIEAVPVKQELAFTRLADEREAAHLLGMLEQRCAAVGSTVWSEKGRLVFADA